MPDKILLRERGKVEGIYSKEGEEREVMFLTRLRSRGLWREGKKSRKDSLPF